MKVLSRRDVPKSSILAPAAAAAQGMKPIETVMHLAGQASGQAPQEPRYQDPFLSYQRARSAAA